MELIYHVENTKTGRVDDVDEADAVDHVARQHSRNDPAMTWARARELASNQCAEARDREGEEVDLYSVTVSTQ